MKVLIIIPAYNEAENIEYVVKDLQSSNIPVDYVVINDCSTDGTKELLLRNGINHINLPVNLGIGGCVQTGFRYALENNYDIAIQFDGDGQHDARYIETLLQPILEQGANVVVGSRFVDKKGFQSSAARRTGIRIISSLIHMLSGVKVMDVTSGMRAYDKTMIRLLAENYEDDYPEPDALLRAALNNAYIVEVPVQMRERMGGTSSINLRKSVYYMVKVCSSLVFMKLMGKWKGAGK